MGHDEVVICTQRGIFYATEQTTKARQNIGKASAEYAVCG